MRPQRVIDFWFAEENRKAWFQATSSDDECIRETFLETWQQGCAGELDDWRESAEGCLALILVFDQFPLNMFRGSAAAYETADVAAVICKHAVTKGFDQTLDDAAKAFLYMPLMHSEDLADQDLSVSLYEKAGLADNLRFARHHRSIVQRFGRFPHRNAHLGRQSTEDEIAWLNSKEAFTG